GPRQIAVLGGDLRPAGPSGHDRPGPARRGPRQAARLPGRPHRPAGALVDRGGGGSRPARPHLRRMGRRACRGLPASTSSTRERRMKLTIFAATGGIGRLVLEQAVAAGHDVTAVVRNPKKLSREVPLVRADLASPDPAVLESAVKGADAVTS